jgi:type VII secretion protein EccE
VVASAPAPKVSATARVPLRFLPVPRRRHASRLRAGHLVMLQVAALAVAASLAGPPWVVALTAAAALAMLMIGFGRSHGRWWYENTAVRRRFRARRRAIRRALTMRTYRDPRLAVLAPSLTVREIELRGNRFGVGLDDTGWYAAFAVAPPSNAEAERRLIEAVDRLGQILVETHAPVSALQLVHHTVPVATMMSAPGQWVWVAVRLDAADASAAAATRGGGVEGVHRALAAAVGRVQKSLRAAGLAYYRVLTADELAGAVAAVGGWGSGNRAVNSSPAERWTAWNGPDAAHVCFRLSGTPTYSLSHLVAGLSQCAVLSFTVSVLLHSGGTDELAVESLLHVAVGGRTVNGTVREVTGLASRIGLQLTRLDGEHASGVYATAPTGRPLR